jgi:hypothetical protein
MYVKEGVKIRLSNTFRIPSDPFGTKVLGRNCSRRHCSQRGLWQQHELYSQLPAHGLSWERYIRYAKTCRDN